MKYSRQNNLISVLINNFDNLESILHICNPKETLNEINLARFSQEVTLTLTPEEEDKLQFIQANILSKGLYTFINDKKIEALKNVNFINHDPLIWQINASMKYLDFKYFELFIEKSMKIVASTYTSHNHPEIFQKLKTASSSILVSFMNYASYCPSEDKNRFYKLFKSKLRSFETEKFKSKIEFTIQPIDFFTKDKNSLSINFYEHFNKSPEKLDKFLEFTKFYFNCVHYPNKINKTNPASISGFEKSENALHAWFMDKIYNLNSQKQQAHLDIFSKYFSISIDGAETAICKKLISECSQPIVKSSISAYDLRQQILESYKLLEHINFSLDTLSANLAEKEVDFVMAFIRNNHYLGVGVGYVNHGKQMPINKLIKICFMDKDRLIKKYEAKYKKLISSLNLSTDNEKDFKTFFILGFGRDLLEEAADDQSKFDNWPFKKLQKLLPNQTQKLEKKRIDKNLNEAIKITAKPKSKFKI